ncbi:uncharacterized [Tachysurus ichikawai]
MNIHSLFTVDGNHTPPPCLANVHILPFLPVSINSSLPPNDFLFPRTEQTGVEVTLLRMALALMLESGYDRNDGLDSFHSSSKIPFRLENKTTLIMAGVHWTRSGRCEEKRPRGQSQVSDGWTC